jgi:hypothetical protein
MPVPRRPLSLSSRLVLCASALCAGSHAAEIAPQSAAETAPPLRIAVARFEAPEACAPAPATPAQSAPLSWSLAAALADSLRARGLASVPDSTLAAWLRRLDATRFPDPTDYRRTREYIAGTGATRLVYVNDVRWTPACALVFEAALWNTEPLSRRSAHGDSAATPAEAAGRLARWLYILKPSPPEKP